MGRGGSVHLSPISFLPKYVLTEFTGFPRLFQDLVELGAQGVQPLGSHRDVRGTDCGALRGRVGPMHVSPLL